MHHIVDILGITLWRFGLANVLGKVGKTVKIKIGLDA